MASLQSPHKNRRRDPSSDDFEEILGQFGGGSPETYRRSKSRQSLDQFYKDKDYKENNYKRKENFLSNANRYADKSNETRKRSRRLSGHTNYASSGSLEEIENSHKRSSSPFFSQIVIPSTPNLVDPSAKPLKPTIYPSPLLPKLNNFCSNVKESSLSENDVDADGLQDNMPKEYYFRKKKPVKYNQMLYSTQVLERGISPVRARNQKRLQTIYDSSCHEGDGVRFDLASTKHREESHICDSGPENYKDNVENRLRLRRTRRHKILYRNRIVSRKRRQEDERQSAATSHEDNTDNESSGSYSDDATSSVDNTKNESKRKSKADFGRVDINKFAFNDTFQDIVGLDGHIRVLTEMILWPLLYPQLFEQFEVSPPTGVLFYGPPGTGKTMMVKALINEYSNLLQKHPSLGKKKVTFYMKSSSDILSKWIGVAEKTMTKLFEEASKNSPSIIFFDELDGLAPARTAKQDQSHISLVSTLLQLMDGIQKKHNVIVIGATNRIDDIDPALRRVGRFDQELFFDLPSFDARYQLFKSRLEKWSTSSKLNMPLSPELTSHGFLRFLALMTEDYNGADIKGVIRETALTYFRRLLSSFPNVDQDASSIMAANLPLSVDDFYSALKSIKASSNRLELISFDVHLQEILANYSSDPEISPYMDQIQKKVTSLCI